MSDFENKVSSCGIHYSRYIASWYRSGGDFCNRDSDGFKLWAMSTGVTKEEADDMWFIATNGKMELEDSAEAFLRRNKENAEEFIRNRRRTRHGLNVVKLNTVKLN